MRSLQDFRYGDIATSSQLLGTLRNNWIFSARNEPVDDREGPYKLKAATVKMAVRLTAPVDVSEGQ